MIEKAVAVHVRAGDKKEVHSSQFTVRRRTYHCQLRTANYSDPITHFS
jgi:hypothetical protein